MLPPASPRNNPSWIRVGLLVALAIGALMTVLSSTTNLNTTEEVATKSNVNTLEGEEALSGKHKQCVRKLSKQWRKTKWSAKDFVAMTNDFEWTHGAHLGYTDSNNRAFVNDISMVRQNGLTAVPDFNYSAMTTFDVRTTHKSMRLGEQTLIVFSDNTVMTADPKSCTLTGLYFTNTQGDFHPYVSRNLDLPIAKDESDSCSEFYYMKCVRGGVTCYESGIDDTTEQCKDIGGHRWRETGWSQIWHCFHSYDSFWVTEADCWEEVGCKCDKCWTQYPGSYPCNALHDVGKNCPLIESACVIDIDMEQRFTTEASTISTVVGYLNLASGFVGAASTIPTAYATPLKVVSASLGLIGSFVGEYPTSEATLAYQAAMTELADAMEEMKDCVDEKIAAVYEELVVLDITSIQNEMEPDKLDTGNPTSRITDKWNNIKTHCADLNSKFVVSTSGLNTDVLVKVIPYALRGMELCALAYVSDGADRLASNDSDLIAGIETISADYRDYLADTLESVSLGISLLYEEWTNNWECTFFDSTVVDIPAKVDVLRNDVEYPLIALAVAAHGIDENNDTNCVTYDLGIDFSEDPNIGGGPSSDPDDPVSYEECLGIAEWYQLPCFTYLPSNQGCYAGNEISQCNTATYNAEARSGSCGSPYEVADLGIPVDTIQLRDDEGSIAQTTRHKDCLDGFREAVSAVKKETADELEVVDECVRRLGRSDVQFGFFDDTAKTHRVVALTAKAPKAPKAPRDELRKGLALLTAKHKTIHVDGKNVLLYDDNSVIVADADTCVVSGVFLGRDGKIHPRAKEELENGCEASCVKSDDCVGYRFDEGKCVLIPRREAEFVQPQFVVFPRSTIIRKQGFGVRREVADRVAYRIVHSDHWGKCLAMCSANANCVCVDVRYRSEVSGATERVECHLFEKAIRHELVLAKDDAVHFFILRGSSRRRF